MQNEISEIFPTFDEVEDLGKIQQSDPTLVFHK